MNQILVSEKLYITPELKRKKRMYKIDFFISVFLVAILFSYYIYAEYDKNRGEAVSQEILASMNFEDNLSDNTTIQFSENSQVVILNSEDPFDIVYKEEELPEPQEDNIIWKETDSGQRYYVLARISIPSIDCNYPILNETTDELLKIAPTKFWGCEPNEVGNFCVVGHNYRTSKFFSNVPDLDYGATINLTDLSGRTLSYEVYDKYVVDPDDVSCTSQRTNGLKEVTIITCTDNSRQRVIVKAREKV